MNKESKWSESEKIKYQNIKQKKLGPFYLQAGISPDKPFERQKYLIEKLNLSINDYRELVKTAKEKGKHIALGNLEERAIKIFF